MLAVYFMKGGTRHRYPQRPTSRAQANAIVDALKAANINAWVEEVT